MAIFITRFIININNTYQLSQSLFTKNRNTKGILTYGKTPKRKVFEATYAGRRDSVMRPKM